MVKVPRRSTRTVIGSDLSDKGAVGTKVNKKICDNCKKLSPVQIDVILNDEGKDFMGAIDARLQPHRLGRTALQIRTQLSQKP